MKFFKEKMIEPVQGETDHIEIISFDGFDKETSITLNGIGTCFIFMLSCAKITFNSFFCEFAKDDFCFHDFFYLFTCLFVKENKATIDIVHIVTEFSQHSSCIFIILWFS